MTNQQDEFTQLLDPLRDRMMCIIWRILRNADDADDALQDALATIWRGWDKVRSHQSPHALIMKICNDSAYEILRRKIRRHGREEHLFANQDNAVDRNTSVEVLSQDEELAQMLQAISELSKNQSAALLLRALDGLSYRDIGAALNCGEATARKHIARARERLRSTFSQFARFGTETS